MVRNLKPIPTKHGGADMEIKGWTMSSRFQSSLIDRQIIEQKLKMERTKF